MSGHLSLANWAISMNEHIEYCDAMSSKPATEAADLSYWTGWNESYQPELYPLGVVELPQV